MSTTDLGSSGDLVDVAHSEDLHHEFLGDHTVAIERNHQQSLVLLETEHASAASAIDAVARLEALRETSAEELIATYEGITKEKVWAI